jgi:hypothetical protein
MGRLLVVNKKNLAEMVAAVEALRRRRDELVKLAAAYPVECAFGGYRCVFVSAVDIDAMIDELQYKIDVAEAGLPSVEASP